MAAAENTAELPPGAAPAADSRLQQTLQNLNALSQRQKVAGAAALALVIALLIGYIMQSGGFGSSGFGMYAGF